MATELEVGLPSINFIQTAIREAKPVEIQLTTSEKLTGKIFWQDPYCIAVRDSADQVIVIWRQAIAYLKSL